MVPRRAPGPFVVRRARAVPRDLRAVSDLLLDAGLTPRRANPERLSADLAANSEVAVMVAERRAEPLGLAIVRWQRTPGVQTPARALIESVYVRPAVRRQGIGATLLEAAVAESEAAGAKGVRAAPDSSDPAIHAFFAACGFESSSERVVFEFRAPNVEDDPPPERLTEPTPLVLAPSSAPAVALVAAPAVEEPHSPDATVVALGGGASARFEDQTPEAAVTLWSGALAFRTRWSADRVSIAWTTDGCIGTPGDDGDALRFDPRTRRLRETYFNRPRAVRIDAERLERVRALDERRGVMVLSPERDLVTLEPTRAALFDVDLAVFAALTERALGGLDGRWEALRVSPELAIVTIDGAYAGWRVRAPATLARPMGWPEVREARPSGEAHLATLTGLLYDWMTIDAQTRVRPDEASDPEDIAHMVSVRDRARALAEVSVGENDPVADVARDIAAHIHWGWGFFRVGE